jgi:hypothetical protein
MQHGLLKPSFIPLRPQRELRELIRYRISLIEEQLTRRTASRKCWKAATERQGKPGASSGCDSRPGKG